jgi:hypothetical protein
MATEPVDRSTRTDNGATEGQSVVLQDMEAKRQAIELAEWHTGTNKKRIKEYLGSYTQSKRLGLQE